MKRGALLGLFLSTSLAVGVGEGAKRKKEATPVEAADGGTFRKQNSNPSGRNEPHANLDARNAALDRVREIEGQIEELEAINPKTKEVKAQLATLKKQKKHWQDKANEKGATDSRKGKGQRSR
jgi:hypothetical protein